MKLLKSLAFILCANLAFSQVSNQETHQVDVKRTSEKIKVDGNLEEAVWKTTEPVGEFWYSFPVDDRAVEAEYQTDVRITYDDKFIYVSAVCRGKGNFLMPSLKRDGDQFWDGDVFGITIDPVNEKTNGFTFATNPAGVQYDVLIGANTGTRGGGGGGGFNTAWDNKWVVNSKEYSDRWVTEMAIPFKSIKYGDGTNWGINFLRGVPDLNSWQTWAPVPVQLNGVDLGFLGQMNWEEVPPRSKSNMSVIPYALASTVKDIAEQAPLDNAFRVGADAKVAITSNLNLDLTLNPDFSQVDVDEQVTNLTTVNIRFPERRLFFLENADIFSEFGIPPMRPFFSRRIGLDDNSNPIPILFGARLTGNLNKNLRIGASNLQTGASDDFLGQNYTLLAFNQQIFGRTSIKGYFNNRQAYQNSEFSATDYNRSLGAEIEYRSIDGSLRLNGGGGMTLSEGVKDKNYTYHAIATYNNRRLNVYSNIMVVGDNYIPDMGFISKIFHYDAVNDEVHRIGYGHVFSFFTYKIFPEKGIVQNYEISGRNNLDYTVNSQEIFDFTYGLGGEINFTNTSGIEVGFRNGVNRLLYPFGFTSGEPLPVGKYDSRFISAEYRSDVRRKFAYEVGFEAGTFYGGRRVQYAIGLNYRAQPWGNFGVNFQRNDVEFAEPYGSTSLTLIGPKIEFNFSRNLFWTSFLQYNTQRDNFNINSRIQWQFQSLSNLFIVYSENYAIEQWGPKNRALVIKANYWLNI